MAPPHDEESSPRDTRTASPCLADGAHAGSTRATPPSESPSPKPEQSSSNPTEPPTSLQTIHNLPLSKIHVPDSHNGRLDVDQADVQHLASQIDRDGLLHPITVRPYGDAWSLIAGLHRLLAYHALGRLEIPANVVDADDERAARLRLTENLYRSELSPVEEARQLADIVEADPNGIDGVADTLHRNPQWILDRLDLLDYDDTLLEHIHAKNITLAAAYHLQRIVDPQTRTVRIRQAAEHGITAATARIWRNDDNLTPPEISQLSENQVETGETIIPKPIRIACFACTTPLEPQNLIRIMICPNCHQAISEANRQEEIRLQQEQPQFPATQAPQPQRPSDELLAPNPSPNLDEFLQIPT